MTTKPRDTNRLGRRGLLLVTGIVTGSLLLAGCVKAPTDAPATPTSSASATHTPTATPSPSATTQPAPKSDSEATKAAESTIDLFYKIRGEVNAAGGTNLAPLNDVSTGNALTVATQDANRIATDKKTTTGALLFTPDTAYSGNLTDSAGKTYPFSSVQVTGCQDGSKYDIKLSDGSEAQRPAAKAEIQITVIFDPASSIWLVQNLVATGKLC